MRTTRRWGMPAVAVLVVLAAAVLAPAAGAATMPSQTSVGQAAQAAPANAAAERQMVKAQLLDLGLAKDQAAGRVQLLTDAEVHVLAAELESIRAGGADGQQTFSMEQVLLIAILVVLLVG